MLNSRLYTVLIGKQCVLRNTAVVWMKDRAGTRQAILLPAPPGHFRSSVTLLTQLASWRLNLPIEHTPFSSTTSFLFSVHPPHMPRVTPKRKEWLLICLIVVPPLPTTDLTAEVRDVTDGAFAPINWQPWNHLCLNLWVHEMLSAARNAMIDS